MQRQRRLLAELLLRLHIDPMRLVHPGGGSSYRDVADLCVSCFESERREAWLRREDEGGEPTPPFCRAPSVLLGILKDARNELLAPSLEFAARQKESLPWSELPPPASNRDRG